MVFAAPPRNQDSIVVIDLGGEDRAAGTIAGALPIPALEILKDMQKWRAEFKGKPNGWFLLPILGPSGAHCRESV